MNISDVEEREETLRRAMLAGDVAALDELVSERLRFVTLDGANVSKKDDLEAHRSGQLHLATLEPGERHIELLGNEVALVNVIVNLAGTLGGTPFAGLFRYTRVWCREDERVRIVAGQVCALQTPPA